MSPTKAELEEAVTSVINILDTFEKRMEKGLRRLEVAMIMQNLMVMQLDGAFEVGKGTMQFYMDALSGSNEAIAAFMEHVKETYRRSD